MTVPGLKSPKSSRALKLFLALVVCCAGTVHALAQGGPEPVPAQPGGQRPEAAKRIVRVFDFEEKRTNPTPVPAYFFRAQDDASVPRERKGFPNWNTAELDYTVAHTGEGAVRLPVKGGSTSLLLEPGVLPIFENADYLITAWVRTENLVNAGAAVAARFVGSGSKPLWSTTVRSTPVRTQGEWTQVELELPGDVPGAAFIQIELLVLQPEQAAEPLDPSQPPDERALDRYKRTVWRQDYQGAAWFDDLAIVQLPRLDLAFNAPSGMLVAPERPHLVLTVRDLTGEALRSRVTLRDLAGNTVDVFDRPLGGGRVNADWEPKVEKYGWYRATLEVMNDKTRVGVAFTDFVWLPPDAADDPVQAVNARPTRTDAEKFGLTITSIEPRLAGVMPEVIKRSGVGAVTVPLWNRELTLKGLDDALAVASPAIDAAIAGWDELTLSLSRVPSELSDPLRIDPQDLWTLFDSDQSKWTAYIDRYLDRFGQIVRRWQLGQAGDDQLFWRPEPVNDLNASERVLGRLVSGPIVTAPWRIDRALPRSLAQTDGRRVTTPRLRVAALVPADCDQDDIRDFASHWREITENASLRPELSLVFAPDRTDQTGYAEQTAVLARKFIAAWAAFSPQPATSTSGAVPGVTPGLAPAIQGQIEQPWTVVGERRPKLMPRPEIAAWRTLHEMLSGRSVVATFPSPPGTICYVLGPRAGEASRGVLVGWNISADPSKAVIRSQLGTGDVRLVDLFGNRTPVAQESLSMERLNETAGRSKPGTVQVVPLGDAPIFVENIDINLARFISNFRIEPAFVKSSSEDQENALVIANPWPVQLEGRATIVQPGGFDLSQGVRDRRWTLQPRSFQFSIPAGQSQKLPFNVSFTPAEEAGMRDFVVQIEATADKNYGVMELATPVELGLKNVRMELAAIPGGRGAGGASDDLVIEARVLNTGKNPLTAEIAVFAPGMPRMKASVAELASGAETTRRFPLAKSFKKLRGQKVIVSLSETDTPNRLNRSVTIE